jgi:hypothetical protein
MSTAQQDALTQYKDLTQMFDHIMVTHLQLCVFLPKNFPVRSTGAPTINHSSRLACNVCHSNQDAAYDQAVMIPYLLLCVSVGK